jgi:arabinofuranosyltransferase
VPPLGSSPAWRWRWPALLLLAAIAWFGALQLSFLCDDAFITFRYVRNAHEGHGLVWNRAPFLPVEGYTGFLWALLLWGCWRLFGVEPPDAANVLSIGFGMLEFAVLAAAALRLRRRDGSRAGDAVALLTLAAIVGNRTFLQWFTGGLETALFNLAFVAWALLGFARAFDRRTLALWSTAATVAALTRPDGLLLAAATAAVAGLAGLRRTLPWRAIVAGLAPLALVVAQVAWRRACYGEWLPNTYFAKITTPWPEAGARYLACFAFEHGAWLPALLAPCWLAVEHLRDRSFLLRALRERPAALAAVGACLFHAGYYVLRVGGDHFEYRVLSQQAPLLACATAAMALRLATARTAALALLLLLLLASGVGWTHLWLSQPLPPHGFARMAPQVPAALQPLARWFDRQQGWLLFQNVGVRAAHHGALLEREFWPPFSGRRIARIDAPADDVPVMPVKAAGVLGWGLPDVALIDEFGLNDWVVARTPVHGGGPRLDNDFLAPVIAAADTVKDGWLDEDEMRAALGALSGAGEAAKASQPADYFVAVLMSVFGRQRLDALTLDEAARIPELLLHARSMAHERHAPPGYVASFAPNVVLGDGRPVVTARATPLTAADVRRLEAEWRAKARAGTLLK